MQVTLPNGLRVFLLEDHELPLVKGSLLMRGGQRARCANSQSPLLMKPCTCCCLPILYLRSTEILLIIAIATIWGALDEGALQMT